MTEQITVTNYPTQKRKRQDIIIKDEPKRKCIVNNKPLKRTRDDVSIESPYNKRSRKLVLSQRKRTRDEEKGNVNNPTGYKKYKRRLNPIECFPGVIIYSLVLMIYFQSYYCFIIPLMIYVGWLCMFFLKYHTKSKSISIIYDFQDDNDDHDDNDDNNNLPQSRYFWRGRGGCLRMKSSCSLYNLINDTL